MTEVTNLQNRTGTLADAMRGADIFVGAWRRRDRYCQAPKRRCRPIRQPRCWLSYRGTCRHHQCPEGNGQEKRRLQNCGKRRRQRRHRHHKAAAHLRLPRYYQGPSRAPLKMPGKATTLLTWLGKSERPVPTTFAPAFFARSGIISGTGFATSDRAYSNVCRMAFQTILLSGRLYEAYLWGKILQACP